MSKTLTTRIKNKTDTSANWEAVPDFVPLEGEIIVYSDKKKIKIGDGNTKISQLPFLNTLSVTVSTSDSETLVFSND